MDDTLEELYNLKIGDLIVDASTEEVGLLVERYNVLEEVYDGEEYVVWAWDIIWTGPEVEAATEVSNRHHSYTEFGLINLIRTGTFTLYKNN